jgi:hypothetical protein
LAQETIIKEIMFWFTRLIDLLLEAMVQMANLVYLMVSDMGVFGKVIRDIIQFICQTINLLYGVYNNTLCVLLKGVVHDILKGCADTFHSIPIVGLALRDVIVDLNRLAQTCRQLNCNQQFNCQSFTLDKPTERLGVLPVTSRCWASYVPTVDDASAFSCAASDTCTNADLSFGVRAQELGGEIAASTRQVLCNACPRSADPNINQFACDTYTKQCSCSRPKLSTTACTSNEECTMQGTPTQCALVNDFTTGRSYGTLECETCPNAVCLISSGARQIGKCACLQQGLRMQTCRAEQVMQSILTDANALCAVTTGSMGGSMNPFATWRSLATAPCAIIKKVKTQFFASLYYELF